jgi:hypothetical protein
MTCVCQILKQTTITSEENSSTTQNQGKKFNKLFNYWSSSVKNLHSDILSGVKAWGSDYGMLHYGLCKLVAKETRLRECRHLQTSPLLKIHTF